MVAVTDNKQKLHTRQHAPSPASRPDTPEGFFRRGKRSATDFLPLVCFGGACVCGRHRNMLASFLGVEKARRPAPEKHSCAEVVAVAAVLGGRAQGHILNSSAPKPIYLTRLSWGYGACLEQFYDPGRSVTIHLFLEPTRTLIRTRFL